MVPISTFWVLAPAVLTPAPVAVFSVAFLYISIWSVKIIRLLLAKRAAFAVGVDIPEMF